MRYPLLAAVVLSGCLFPSDETGWTLTYPAPQEGEVGRTHDITANETIPLVPPRNVVIGSFNGRVAEGTTLLVLLEGTIAARTTITYVTPDADPLIEACVIGEDDPRDVQHAIGTLSIQASNTTCTYEMSFARTLDNPGGNEIVWDLRIPAGGAGSSARFFATTR